jgi:hypothetical protein
MEKLCQKQNGKIINLPCHDKQFERLNTKFRFSCFSAYQMHMEYLKTLKKSQGSSVSTTADYGLDKWASITGLTSISRPAMQSTQPHIQWVAAALSPEAKCLGYETDHSPPSSASQINTGATPRLTHKSSWRSAW